MKTAFIGLFLLVMASAALAQTILRGSLRDASSKPLPFASVALLNAHDSTLVKGSLASEAGQYQFDQVAPGQYRVLVSMVGFEPIKSAVVTVVNSPVQLPVLTLLETARKLNEVTVTAQKPLYEQQIDRMVINVQSSITSAGATALEVLERSPGVIVDRQNNTLAMNGKQGVMVMLNGRLTRLPLEAVMQMLWGMQASNIDKIELITSPPAQYDAEGNAGLINIVTKKNLNLGTNGGYSGNVGYGRYERYGGSGNINHKTEKLSLYADYSGLLNHYAYTSNGERKIIQPNPLQTTITAERDYRDWTHNGRAGVDYQLSPKTTLSGLATAYSFHSQQVASSLVNTTQGGNPINSIVTQDHELNQYWIYTGTLSARHQFSPTQELSVDGDYVYYFSTNPHQYQFQYTYPPENRQETQQLQNTKQTPIQLWAAKADYSGSLGPKTRVNLGVKGAFSHFDNNLQAIRQINQQWQVDSTLSQHAKMDETIQAAYVNLTHQPSTKTKVQAGLRYEHTVTDLRTIDNQPLVYRNYSNWFPSLFFSQELSPTSSIQFAYNRRITRPPFTFLAPFLTFVEPNTTVGGNVRLFPALSSNGELTYRFRKNVLLTLRYSQTRNAISFITLVIPATNQVLLQPQNLDRLTVSSFGLTLPGQLAPWWQTQTNLEGISQQTRLIQDGVGIDRSTAFVRLNTTHTFRLPHEFTAEVSGLYQSAALNGITVRKPFGFVNIGLQKKLKNNAGTLRLSADDIFWTMKAQTYINNPELGYTLQNQNRPPTRLARLTYTRTFGNQKVKINSRSIGSAEDRQRVN